MEGQEDQGMIFPPTVAFLVILGPKILIHILPQELKAGRGQEGVDNAYVEVWSPEAADRWALAGHVDGEFVVDGRYRRVRRSGV